MSDDSQSLLDDNVNQKRNMTPFFCACSTFIFANNVMRETQKNMQMGANNYVFSVFWVEYN